MADTRHYDLVIIGSGPGGYVAAIRAAQLRMKVACIERDKLGGVCLNWGCIPSKALLHTAELYQHAIAHGKDWGFDVDPAKVKVDWPKVIGRSRDITVKISGGVGFLFKKNKIDHIAGHAKIISGKSAHGPCTIEVREAAGNYYNGTADAKKPPQIVTADKIIIATGAKPRELPGGLAPLDGKQIVSSYDAMNLPKKPESMVIVGSGAIGMEFAYFYNSFGTKTTVVEMVDRILPIEDDDVSKLALRSFTKQGMTFHVGSTVKAAVKSAKGVKVTIVDVTDDKKTQDVECDVLLVAIGVQARIDGLVDDKLGLKLEKGYIATDYRSSKEPAYKTSVPGVYAIGDCIGPPWLAHVAMEEGVTCVERMAGQHTLGIDYNMIPGCTYCNPQIGSIGKTERDVKASGIKYKVGKYPYQAHGKAIAVGATEGVVKIITSEPYGEILGAHIFGEDASEVIAEISLAMRLEATAEDIISTIHAHPTMHEGVHEAALATEGRAIHI